jgi:hypothetical protein
MSGADLLRSIQAEFRQGGYRLTVHSLQEATKDRISIQEVMEAILDGNAEIVEDYPDDPRGSSCLILGRTGDGRALHVVVSYPPDPAVITVYVPDPERWVDYRTRRTS